MVRRARCLVATTLLRTGAAHAGVAALALSFAWRLTLPTLAALVAAVLAVGAPASAATITVNDLFDTSGGATCTLRNSITAANTNAATGGCGRHRDSPTEMRARHSRH